MAAQQTSLSFTIFWNLFKLMSLESVIPSNYLIFCQHLLLLSSIFAIIRVFSNESVLCIRRPNYSSYSFSISPSKEYSGLIGSPFSLKDSQESPPTPQFKSISSLALSFFMVQLSHPYVTIWKIVTLIRRTFAGKVMSLLFIYLFFFHCYSSILFRR